MVEMTRVRTQGCPNALTESNSWHSDHVETEESFYPHPSPISVSALAAERATQQRKAESLSYAT